MESKAGTDTLQRVFPAGNKIRICLWKFDHLQWLKQIQKRPWLCSNICPKSIFTLVFVQCRSSVLIIYVIKCLLLSCSAICTATPPDLTTIEQNRKTITGFSPCQNCAEFILYTWEKSTSHSFYHLWWWCLGLLFVLIIFRFNRLFISRHLIFIEAKLFLSSALRK